MAGQATPYPSSRPVSKSAGDERASRPERLRIVHLVGHSALNGVATSVRGLIDAQLAAGHEVMLVHPLKSWIGGQSFVRPVTRLATNFSMKPRELGRVGSAIRGWDRGLLHAHGSGANKYAMVYRLIDGVPAVMTAHARKYQLPWMFAHGVIGLSEPTIAYYTSRLLVLRKRIFNIPNLFSTEGIEPVTASARSAARTILGLPSQGLLIGSVGGIDERKRQIDIVGVLGRLVRSGLDVRLALIGRPPRDPEVKRALEAAMRDDAVAGRIHLAGPRENAAALTAALDVYICASAVEEAPIAPVEAMARAVPVVSTRVGNMTDLLPADRLLAVGDVVGLADAVAMLLGDPRVAQATGLRDREAIAATLSPAIVLPRIEAVYRTAMAAARDRRRSSGRKMGAKIPP